MADIILRGVTTTQVNQEYGRTPTAAFVQQSRQHTRYAEARLERQRAGELSPLQIRLVNLERIALNPHAHPHVKDRPGRPLYSISLWSWIAKRSGIDMRPEDVRGELRDADIILARQSLRSID